MRETKYYFPNASTFSVSLLKLPLTISSELTMVEISLLG